MFSHQDDAKRSNSNSDMLVSIFDGLSFQVMFLAYLLLTATFCMKLQEMANLWPAAAVGDINIHLIFLQNPPTQQQEQQNKQDQQSQQDNSLDLFSNGILATPVNQFDQRDIFAEIATPQDCNPSQQAAVSSNLLQLDPFSVAETSRPAITHQWNSQLSFTSPDNNKMNTEDKGPVLDLMDPYATSRQSSSGQEQPIKHLPLLNYHANTQGPSLLQSVVTPSSSNAIQLTQNSVLPQRHTDINYFSNFAQSSPTTPRSSNVTSSIAPPMTSTTNSVATRDFKSNSSQSSNGFNFLSSKKPGAFDFVKEAMEASKRK